jgi:hypothetical protein
VAGYTNNALTYTLQSGDGIASGKTYTFMYRSKNIVAYSDYSEQIRIAVASPISQPAKPTKDYVRSTKTSITVLWSESTATEVPVLGYKLYMSAGTDEYSVVYSDAQNSLLREYTASNLTTGVYYQFKVAAINFNGDSV